MNKSLTTIELIPKDILLIIFDFIFSFDEKERLRISVICKQWCNLIKHNFPIQANLSKPPHINIKYVRDLRINGILSDLSNLSNFSHLKRLWIRFEASENEKKVELTIPPLLELKELNIMFDGKEKQIPPILWICGEKPINIQKFFPNLYLLEVNLFPLNLSGELNIVKVHNDYQDQEYPIERDRYDPQLSAHHFIPVINTPKTCNFEKCLAAFRAITYYYPVLQISSADNDINQIHMFLPELIEYTVFALQQPHFIKTLSQEGECDWNIVQNMHFYSGNLSGISQNFIYEFDHENNQLPLYLRQYSNNHNALVSHTSYVSNVKIDLPTCKLLSSDKRETLEHYKIDILNILPYPFFSNFGYSKYHVDLHQDTLPRYVRPLKASVVSAILQIHKVLFEIDSVDEGLEIAKNCLSNVWNIVFDDIIIILRWFYDFFRPVYAMVLHYTYNTSPSDIDLMKNGFSIAQLIQHSREKLGERKIFYSLFSKFALDIPDANLLEDQRAQETFEFICENIIHLSYKTVPSRLYSCYKPIFESFNPKMILLNLKD